MAWIVQFLPAFIAMVTQLMPLIQAIINAFQHKAATGSLMATSNPDWWLYCPGQALAGTAGALLLLCLQPTANRMAKAHREVREFESATNEALAMSRRASMMAPAHQAIVRN